VIFKPKPGRSTSHRKMSRGPGLVVSANHLVIFARIKQPISSVLPRCQKSFFGMVVAADGTPQCVLPTLLTRGERIQIVPEQFG